MSLFKSLAGEIPDHNPKISVGIAVRKVTTYMYEELMRVIKELAPMKNMENKKNTLQILVREFHNATKKLHKFLKNARNFEKISRIDKLTFILFEFNNTVKEAVDQLFFTYQKCKLYRMPTFNIKESVKVITNTSHNELRKRIAETLNSVALQESKENIIHFLEKFYYGENLSENNKSQIIDKMKRESLFELSLANNLLPLQNVELREFVRLKDDCIIFRFGEVSFKIVLFNYQIEQDHFFSYFCQDFTLSNNQKYFTKITESIKKYLSYLNNNLIYSNVQVSLPSENQSLDLKLAKLQTILRDFTFKYIYKSVFKQIKTFLKEYVNKKIKNCIKVNSSGPHEIKLFIEYEVNSEPFYLELKMSSLDEANNFHVNCSHVVVSENPFLFSRNHSMIINFCQLGKMNLEKIINDKIKAFEKIHLYMIYEKFKHLKSIFIPIKVHFDEDNSVIKFFYKDKFTLFSLLNDIKGNIQVTDVSHIFSTKEKFDILKAYVVQYLKFGLDENMKIKFNEFVFEHFIQYYFNMNRIFLSYEKYHQGKISLKVLITESKSLNKRVLLDICITILTGNKFIYSDLSLNAVDLTKDETIFSLPIDENTINKELKLNKKNKIEKFEVETLNKIVSFIHFISLYYEDLLRNVMETLSYVNYVVEDNMKIIIKVDESSNELQNFIDKENNDLFKLYVKEIQITPKNLIFKIYLNEENLRSILPQLSNYTLFDTDNIINFNQKECAISFYFLTKINIKAVNDHSYFKRFFVKIMNKLLNFIKKEVNIINSTEMKNILLNSENVLISPIGFQFKYNFFGLYTKSVFVQFLNYANHEKKNMKCMIAPLEYHLSSIYSFDMLLKLLQESDEMTFLPNLSSILFLSLIYNKLANKFSTFIFPIGNNTYDMINSKEKIFVFMKDHKTFHIIKQNKLSLLLEIVNPNLINIFSSYLWNSENCFKFINSITSNNEIQSKSTQANSFASTKKLIIINNDSLSLLNDLEQILDHIENF